MARLGATPPRLQGRTGRLVPLATRLGAALVTLIGMIASTGPAVADFGTATLTLTGPAHAQTSRTVTLTSTLADPSGSVADRPIVLEREDASGSWQPVATATTSADGVATFPVAVTSPADQAANTYRVETDDATPTTSAPFAIDAFATSSLTLSAPSWRFVDETSRTLTVRWRADDGTAIPGTVAVYRRTVGGSYTLDRTLALGRDGTVSFSVSPRSDTRWLVRGLQGPWWLAQTSASHFLDNLPPGRPVAYPAAAPAPQKLPAQAHASGSGPHVVITAIPTSVWRTMVGRSWHRGCPVGRARLRLIQVNYWDFAGYRRRGAMVLNVSVARHAADALADMYRQRFPLRAMYLVDRFGWSSRTHGADDYAAMRHDNSDGFNCRWVDGRSGVLSPHAWGTAVDLNTWENPYHSAQGIVPNRWWATHQAARITYRSASNPVVRIWRRHGFAWTYGNQDPQHLDGRYSRARQGLPATAGFVAE